MDENWSWARKVAQYLDLFLGQPERWYHEPTCDWDPDLTGQTEQTDMCAKA